MVPEHSPDDAGAHEQPELDLDHCQTVQGSRATAQPPVHYPWRSVSSQLMDSKGKEILFPVDSDTDRKWARRLEWVVDKHRDGAELDLEELHADFKDVLRQSKEAHRRKYDQEHIAALNKRLEQANQALRAHRLYAWMA